jgi:hypothetical protein
MSEPALDTEEACAKSDEEIPQAQAEENESTDENQASEECKVPDDESHSAVPPLPQIPLSVLQTPPTSPRGERPASDFPPRSSSSPSLTSVPSPRSATRSGRRRPSIEPDARVRTLRDYTEAPAKMKSPRGIDLEQVTTMLIISRNQSII